MGQYQKTAIWLATRQTIHSTKNKNYTCHERPPIDSTTSAEQVECSDKKQDPCNDIEDSVIPGFFICLGGHALTPFLSLMMILYHGDDSIKCHSHDIFQSHSCAQFTSCLAQVTILLWLYFQHVKAQTLPTF